MGWQASTTKYENRVVFDFQQYTPKGQDFNVSVEMKDGDFDRFLCELENFYEATMISSTTLNTRMTFFMNPPR